MGWSAWVEINTGNGYSIGTGDFELSHTHNCNEMIRKALDAVGELEPLGERYLYALDGKPCDKVANILSRALMWWETQPKDYFKQFEPDNGWGTAETAFKFWSEVHLLCAKHPIAVLRLNG